MDDGRPVRQGGVVASALCASTSVAKGKAAADARMPRFVCIWYRWQASLRQGRSSLVCIVASLATRYATRCANGDVPARLPLLQSVDA